MSVRLSSASKMPCSSWSLPALYTCPGAIGGDGKPVPACSRCYALQGRYLFGSVKSVRDHNRDDWQRTEWVADMVAAIGSDPFFRWFDSGDVYHPVLASKILKVMQRTPNTKHWLPTRARKDNDILSYLEEMAKLPNVVVRHSADAIDGSTDDVAQFANFASITSNDAQAASKVGRGKVVCQSSKRGGRCGPCRACWSQKVVEVTYPLHGGKVSEKTIDRILAPAMA